MSAIMRKPWTEDDLQVVKERAEKRFRVIDNLPREVRELVHEYGWEAVKLLMELGAKSPGQMRHIIKTIRGQEK